MNNLMIFEGNNVEVFELEGKVLFNPRHVGKCLELGDSAIRMAIKEMNEKQVIKLKNSDISKIGITDFRKLNNAGENFITESGLKHLISHSNSMKKEEVLKAFGFNDFIIINRFETSFGQVLEETFKPLGIKLEIQKLIFDGKYRIDFYLPEYKLAIEYDEVHHKYKKEEDTKRQLEIEKELGCKFVRLDYKNNDNYNVGIVIREIMKVMVAC